MIQTGERGDHSNKNQWLVKAKKYGQYKNNASRQNKQDNQI